MTLTTARVNGDTVIDPCRYSLENARTRNDVAKAIPYSALLVTIDELTYVELSARKACIDTDGGVYLGGNSARTSRGEQVRS